MSYGASDRKLYINGTEITGELVIPDGVTSIGDYAFQWCASLTSVTIPDSVTEIGYRAFQYCNSLISVTFKNTSDWRRFSSNPITSGTSISSTNLADPATAAQYLTVTYCGYYWKRG